MSGWTGGNKYLSVSEMKQNADYIWAFLSGQGWTKNSVAGMLGNMQSESSINPQIWQSLTINWNHGYGLVQWTPATKLKEWSDSSGLDYTQMDTQLHRIIYEKDNGLQWGTTVEYPVGFDEFITSTLSANYLGMTWLYNYERPANLNQPQRGQQAELWYNYLSNTIPVPPVIFLPKRMKLIYYLRGV